MSDKIRDQINELIRDEIQEVINDYVDDQENTQKRVGVIQFYPKIWNIVLNIVP